MIKEIIALEAGAQKALTQNYQRKAIQLRKQAIKSANEIGESLFEAVLLERLGAIYEKQDNIQYAIYMYEAGLKALNKEEAYDLSVTFKKLRRATKGYHEQELAIPDLYSPSVEASLEEAAKDPLLAIRLMVLAGNMYLIQPQPVPALEFYQEALKQSGLESAPNLKASILSNIAEIHRQQGKTEEAGNQLQEALVLFEKEVDKRKAISMLASIAQQNGNYEKALELYDSALVLYDEINDEEGRCKIHAQLGQLYLAKQDLSRSKNNYEKALELSEKTQMKGHLWHIYWGLGFIASRTEKYEEAKKYLEKSLSRIRNRQNNLRTDEGKVAFLDSVSKVFELLINVNLKLNNSEEALKVVEEAKAQALLDMMNGRKRRRANRIKGNHRRTRNLRLPDDEAPPSDMMVQMAVGVDSFSNIAPPDLSFPFQEE